MLLALSLTLLAPQQLEPAPYPAAVGQSVTVRATQLGQAIVGLPVQVRKPSGPQVACGVTDAMGAVVYVPEEVGFHVFVAKVGGVEVLAPLPVTAPRRSWWAAFVLVPLGLALAWHNLRRGTGRATAQP